MKLGERWSRSRTAVVRRATGSLGRQVFVMLIVALFAGGMSTALFSWVFTGEWVPWLTRV